MTAPTKVTIGEAVAAVDAALTYASYEVERLNTAPYESIQDRALQRDLVNDIDRLEHSLIALVGEKVGKPWAAFVFARSHRAALIDGVVTV